MSTPAFPTPTSPLFKVITMTKKAANESDFTTLASHLAPEFSYQMWPSSVRPAGSLNQRTGKEVWIDRMKAFHEGWIENIGFDIDHPVNVVEGENSLVVQLTSQGKLRTGKEHHQEYLLIYRFNKDNKIVSLDEWIDSAYAKKVWGDEVMPKFDADGRVTNVEEAKKAWAK